MTTFIRALFGAVALAAAASAVWLEGATLHTCFYPFSHAHVVPADDDGCTTVDDEAVRGFRVPFLGGTYDYLGWDRNGQFTFDETCEWTVCFTIHDTDTYPFGEEYSRSDAVVVAIAYLMDAYDAGGGSQYMQLLTTEEMAPMLADVVAAGIAPSTFNPSWGVQVTVVSTHTVFEVPGEVLGSLVVAVAAPGPFQLVSYQAVLISDSAKTYAIYKYGALTVPGEPDSESSQQELYCHFQAPIGFYDHPNLNAQMYKIGVVSQGAGSESNSLLMMTETNCGVPGMVVFDVTDAAVVQPADGAQCTGDCGDSVVPSGDCARCTAGSTDQCYYAGYCFDVGTIVADLACTLACTCEEGGKWDKCKPLKKDSDPRKMACLSCRTDDNEEPCTEEGVGTVVFGDSAGCGMAQCLLTGNAKVCGDAGVPCTAADVDAKYLVGKVPMLKGKSGWLNWCNAADPPDAE